MGKITYDGRETSRAGSRSWDAAAGEEPLISTGLFDSYDAAWCAMAMEYYEYASSILLPNIYKLSVMLLGLTLLHHAILYGKVSAVDLFVQGWQGRSRTVRVGLVQIGGSPTRGDGPPVRRPRLH